MKSNYLLLLIVILAIVLIGLMIWFSQSVRSLFSDDPLVRALEGIAVAIVVHGILTSLNRKE